MVGQVCIRSETDWYKLQKLLELRMDTIKKKLLNVEPTNVSHIVSLQTEYKTLAFVLNKAYDLPSVGDIDDTEYPE